MPTVEPYKIGHCPQCQAQIAVQDPNGKWSSKKKNWAQMDMTFSDGHKVRTTICKTCLLAPDYQKIMDAIFAPDSQACSEKTKEFLKYKIVPVEIETAIEGDIQEDNAKGLSENLGNVLSDSLEQMTKTQTIIEYQKQERGLPISHQVKA